MTRRAGRYGTTVVEAMVALLLLLLLTTGALVMVAAQRKAVGRALVRAETIAVERMVRTVLLEETRAGSGASDWWLDAPGVLALRAFRAWGMVCPGLSPEGGLLVHANGIRGGDPDKDSVLALGAAGDWRVAALVRRSADAPPCPADPGRPVELWHLDPAVPTAVLVRLFERGSYHLEDGTLRYRRGRGGRQPLTGDLLDPDSTGLEAVPGGGVVVRARGRGPGSGWSRRLGPGWARPLDPGGAP